MSGGGYPVFMHRKTERGPFVWNDIGAVTQYIQQIIYRFTEMRSAIHDDELCVRMLFDEHLELVAQSSAQRAGLRCEVERIGSFHAEHLEQTLLDARVIVLQSEVENLARMDIILPEGVPVAMW